MVVTTAELNYIGVHLKRQQIWMADSRAATELMTFHRPWYYIIQIGSKVSRIERNVYIYLFLQSCLSQFFLHLASVFILSTPSIISWIELILALIDFSWAPNSGKICNSFPETGTIFRGRAPKILKKSIEKCEKGFHQLLRAIALQNCSIRQ